MTTLPRTGMAGWTLRQRLSRASLALLVLVAVLVVVIVVALLDVKHKGDEVVQRWDPAYSASQNALSALVNQETGVRGYALGRTPNFLEPYREYLQPQRDEERALAGYLAGHPDLLRSLTAFRAAADSWRTSIAEPFIARVRADDPSVADAATSLAAKRSFDAIRAASATLTADVDAVRDQAQRDRVRAFTLVWIAIGIGVTVLLAAGLVLRRALDRSVLTPIELLGRQTREVAAGDVDRTIVESGPPELVRLGRDVDVMRARIAQQLARVERSRARLAERGAELARSNADLEQFAYVASHDLSEPLRKVTNFCQLLERRYSADLDDRARQYIAFVVDGAKRMQILINDLLEFSRVGRTTENFVPVDLDLALTRALSTLDDAIEAAQVEIVRGALPTVPGDATLLTALLQNLVGNAVKYHSAEREPRIEIAAERRDDGDVELWHITVTDNGIGIEAKYADRIFAIFQRLHLRDDYGGTGIGLALCRKIVEFHRGQLWLAEHDGPGAKFQFTLPARSTPLETPDDDEH